MSGTGDLTRLSGAYLLAAQAHAGQTRKGAGGIPYINHPCEVADLVARAGGSADMVIAAVLHDVIEDSDTTEADIAARFGGPVASMVAALTDPPGWDDLPRAEKKARQAAHLRDAAAEAKAIKIADQTSNLNDIVRDPAAWRAADAAGYVDGAELVVAACRGAAPAIETAFDAAVREARRKLETGP